MMGSGGYISKEVLQGVAAHGALGPRRDVDSELIVGYGLPPHRSDIATYASMHAVLVLTFTVGPRHCMAWMVPKKLPRCV
jgi:hypothetical protein